MDKPGFSTFATDPCTFPVGGEPCPGIDGPCATGPEYGGVHGYMPPRFVGGAPDAMGKA